MAGEETEAALEWIQEAYPDTKIKFRDCYYKIERDDVLEFDMLAISELLGRELTTEMFLVSMTTYYGRMVRSNDKIQICRDPAGPIQVMTPGGQGFDSNFNSMGREPT